VASVGTDSAVAIDTCAPRSCIGLAVFYSACLLAPYLVILIVFAASDL